MSETVLTSPIILDATGQDMLTKLDSIISAINPVAQGVSYDNAGTGMVATNVQSAITELKTGLVNTNSSLTKLESRLISTTLTYNSTLGYFPIPNNLPVPANEQITLTVRNGATGALYVVWYDKDNRCFRIGTTLSGNAPTNNNGIRLQYLATSS